MMQGHTELLHQPSLNIWRGNSQCPIPLKISRLGYTRTISESGEIRVSGLGRLRGIVTLMFEEEKTS